MKKDITPKSNKIIKISRPAVQAERGKRRFLNEIFIAGLTRIARQLNRIVM
jgi:hypothetical protein